MEILIIINCILYSLLFLVFLIRITDENERNLYEKIIYFFIIVYSLFMGGYTFKSVFIYEKTTIAFSISGTIFKTLIVLLMLIKIKEDILFKNKK